MVISVGDSTKLVDIGINVVVTKTFYNVLKYFMNFIRALPCKAFSKMSRYKLRFPKVFRILVKQT